MSHDEHADLRVRRTHKFLQEAIIDLIAEKGFDTITVGDIAERAMINRATFYRHYQDKYDLVAKIFEDTAKQLLENTAPIKKDASHFLNTEPPEIWVQVFQHVAEHARLYRAMLGRNGSPWFAERIREQMMMLILDRSHAFDDQSQFKRQIDPALPDELPAMQFAHVFTGTIVWWLESEQRYTPKQIASWFYRFAIFGFFIARGYQVALRENT